MDYGGYGGILLKAASKALSMNVYGIQKNRHYNNIDKYF